MTESSRGLRHTVLMGDPEHFSVVGGANPHTRDWLLRRRQVDRTLAIRQWERMRNVIVDLGLRVVVVPPDPAWPGLVYPANAGVRLPAEWPGQPRAASTGTCARFTPSHDFVLSHLIPTRSGELDYYRRAIEPLGLRCHTVSARFEGEADLFPAGAQMLFTHGEIRRQRVVPRLGMPPWKRIYGFRSEPAVLSELEKIRALPPILRLELCDERYYHGDTCLCSFGHDREHLLVYLPALMPDARVRVQGRFGDQLIRLSDADAALYAANSFACQVGREPVLVMPAGISSRLQSAVAERGVRVVKVDVSEFMKKGGGSVKCMIGDLGALPEPS
jgi:N-dimethylarginine dimethylaminohydrolase